jgi:hypothetical protein
MGTEIKKLLGSLPKIEASFVEPMECLSVSKLPEGLEWFGRSYVAGAHKSSYDSACQG